MNTPRETVTPMGVIIRETQDNPRNLEFEYDSPGIGLFHGTIVPHGSGWNARIYYPDQERGDYNPFIKNLRDAVIYLEHHFRTLEKERQKSIKKAAKQAQRQQQELNELLGPS